MQYPPTYLPLLNYKGMYFARGVCGLTKNRVDANVSMKMGRGQGSMDERGKGGGGGRFEFIPCRTAGVRSRQRRQCVLLSHGVTAPIVLASSLRLGVFRRELIVERGREGGVCHAASASTLVRVVMAYGGVCHRIFRIKTGFGGGCLVLVSLLRAYMTGESVHQECLRGVLYFLQLLFFACVIDNYIVRYRLLSSRRGG